MANWLLPCIGPSRGGLLVLLLALCTSLPARAEVLQDPTAPLAGMSKGAGAGNPAAGVPRLQSVILGNGPALAVLNGRSYRVGQQVEGYRLVAIGADSVVLEKGGKRLSLTLFGRKIGL